MTFCTLKSRPRKLLADHLRCKACLKRSPVDCMQKIHRVVLRSWRKTYHERCLQGSRQHVRDLHGKHCLGRLLADKALCQIAQHVGPPISCACVLQASNNPLLNFLALRSEPQPVQTCISAKQSFLSDGRHVSDRQAYILLAIMQCRQRRHKRPDCRERGMVLCIQIRHGPAAWGESSGGSRAPGRVGCPS